MKRNPENSNKTSKARKWSKLKPPPLFIWNHSDGLWHLMEARNARPLDMDSFPRDRADKHAGHVREFLLGACRWIPVEIRNSP